MGGEPFECARKIYDASVLLGRICDAIKNRFFRSEEKEVAMLLEKTEFFMKELDVIILIGAMKMIDSDSDTTWLSE